MKRLLFKISNGVKKHQVDIILIVGVMLISLLSFAMGFITAKQQEKQPLKFEKVNEAEASFPSAFLINKNLINEDENSYNRSGDKRAVSCLEAFKGRS